MRVRNLFPLLVFGVAGGLYWHYGSGRTRSQEPSKLTVGEWLDYCSPFKTLNGTRVLIFLKKNNRVTMSEAVGDERDKGALSAKHPVVAHGHWDASEMTKEVVVTLDTGAVLGTYVLVIPSSESYCILAAGAFNAADLSQSWIGEPTPPTD